jgi:hypothetical protein
MMSAQARMMSSHARMMSSQARMMSSQARVMRVFMKVNSLEHINPSCKSNSLRHGLGRPQVFKGLINILEQRITPQYS